MRPMINTDPTPSYSQLRVAALSVATVAVVVAVSGGIGSGTVLAWTVAAIALAIFGASYYLKS